MIVYAHQSSSSFNAAAKDAAVEVLTAQGCTVEVSDLYAIKFKAAATAEDIIGTCLASSEAQFSISAHRKLFLLQERSRMPTTSVTLRKPS